MMGCFETRTPSDEETDSSQPSAKVALGFSTIKGPSATGSLLKASAAGDPIVIVQGTSGAMTITDTARGDSGQIIMDLPSNRPWAFEGRLIRNGRTENQGKTSPVFLAPGSQAQVGLTLMPLYGKLSFRLDSAKIPGYLGNVSLRIKTPSDAYTGMPKVEFEIPVNVTVPCSVMVIADYAGNVQSPVFTGIFSAFLQSGENTRFPLTLAWTSLAPVPGVGVISVNVVNQGVATADIELRGHPKDSDGDLIPDPQDLCPHDPDPLCMIPADGWNEEFDESTLAPEWKSFEWAEGHSSPTNHFALIGGVLHYVVDPMTYTALDSSAGTFQGNPYLYLPGLRLIRSLGGSRAWTMEVKATYNVPLVVNAAGFSIHVRLGSDADHFDFGFERYSNDDSRCDCERPDNNTLSAYAGPVRWNIAAPLGQPTITRWIRFQRSGNSASIYASEDYVSWTLAVTSDIPAAYQNVPQHLILSGQAWFSPVGSYADYDYVRFLPSSGAP